MFLVAFSLSMHASLSSMLSREWYLSRNLSSGLGPVMVRRLAAQRAFAFLGFEFNSIFIASGAEIWKIMRIWVCLCTFVVVEPCKGFGVMWRLIYRLAGCASDCILPMLTLLCLMRLSPMHLRPDWVSIVKLYLQLSIILLRNFGYNSKSFSSVSCDRQNHFLRLYKNIVMLLGTYDIHNMP